MRNSKISLSDFEEESQLNSHTNQLILLSVNQKKTGITLTKG